MTIYKNAQFLIFSTFLLFLTAISAHAADATFSWTASDVSGYKIHYGTSSRNYNFAVDVGLPIAVGGEIIASVDGLLEGQTYYFAASAYSLTEESNYSAEVVYTVPGAVNPVSTPPTSLSFEVGEIMVDSSLVRVNFSSPFSRPVIIANTITRNDTAPSVIRISDVDAQGFTIQIQPYDYLESGHGIETVSYLVMEKGSYTLDDGSQIEAGLFDTNATDFSVHSLVNRFDVTPVVFTSITTSNGSDAVIGRLQNVSTTGFEYLLQEQEANSRYHCLETVAYLAWTPGSGITNGIHFQVGNTADAVSHTTFAINFNQNFSELPFQFAGMQTTDGGDTAAVKVIHAGVAGMEIMIEEETSKDSETDHTNEIAGFLALLPE